MVLGEHFVLKDLPFYTEAREADAQACQERLNQREERMQEGTLRRTPDVKRPAPFPLAHLSAEKKKKVPTKGIVIRSPVPSASSASSSESSPSRRVPGQYESEPSFPASERLLPTVEEEPTVNQPGSPYPHPGDAATQTSNQPAVEETHLLTLSWRPQRLLLWRSQPRRGWIRCLTSRTPLPWWRRMSRLGRG